MSTTAEKEDNKVFVGNLSFSTDKEALGKYFESAGKVINATVIRRGRYRSAGYGFVTFETSEEAEKAVEKFNKTNMDEREITVQVARPKTPRTTKTKNTTSGRRRRSLPTRRPTAASTTRVFVANLPYSTTDEELASLFENFNIESASIARLRNGRSKGFGFIDVKNETEQQKVIENFKDVKLGDREISVKVAMVPVDLDAAENEVKQEEQTEE
ncbi:uncharacterized protein BX664DRAFT_347542 [Halteromyces radiatus]|uniref:uncharacterized protein n=1 Tax=Halteromyces radiatus TaxID=101107 RepID=UPI002220D2FD|nr:uncharacterized protein BX664DRAFT_347542 [Halteromyces radiatus]KAI8097577.1 hypothetical protein BX664DRAFT_347542 [Halteromyces radiatus]